MEYVRLGRTGLKVSRVWLGMMSYGDPDWRDWVLDEAAAEAFVIRALEAGINTFDTADMYSLGISEKVTGKLLLKHAPRSEIVIATKLFFPHNDEPNQGGLSRKHVMDAIDASLRRLGTDHVDLYQIHRFDPDVPVEETMAALHDVVRAGKARYLGASSMHAWQFAKMQRVAAVNGWTEFVSMQPHYNLLYREEEREMLPLCLDQGVGVVPWSPLARGVLARPRDAYDDKPTARAESDGFTPYLYDEAALEIVDRVGQVADEVGASRAQVALSWVLRNPAVTAPIVGATKMDHLEQALGALDVVLSDEQVARLEEPYVPREVRGHG
ncbi:MAG: aldo/keto reductase [Actinobacteria bacterium]|nr:aldo/keto reductase [Actinomycetota bacterium]